MTVRERQLKESFLVLILSTLLFYRPKSGTPPFKNKTIVHV